MTRVKECVNWLKSRGKISRNNPNNLKETQPRSHGLHCRGNEVERSKLLKRLAKIILSPLKACYLMRFLNKCNSEILELNIVI